MPGTVNPYAAVSGREAGEAPGPVIALLPHRRYEVPDIPETTDPNNTDGGFSPELTPSPDGTALPDDIRIGKREPPVNDPNNYGYTMRRDANRKERQADEVTTGSWNVQQRKVPAPIVPEWTQERMPIRPSAVRSPLGYLFSRPWHRPRNVREAVGEDAPRHLSMADHRRTYPIMGMVPRGRTGMNTFRLDPRPWDETLVTPISQQPATASGGGSPVFGGSRNFRL